MPPSRHAVPDGQRTRACIARFPERSVLVVGDVMVDQFVFGRVHRISPEAPVPVVEFDHEERRLGGAANVAANVRALGGRVAVVGVIGDDEPGRWAASALAAQGIAAEGLVRDPSRDTTRKLRIVTTRQQQVARIDYESDDEVAPEIAAAIVRSLERAAAQAEVLVVSDYLKGVITAEVMTAVMRCGDTRRVPVLVDPKIPHLGLYQGATLVTPNQLEAEIATHLRIRSDEDALRAARALRDQVRCQSVLITRGEHGMCVLDGSGPGSESSAGGTLRAAAREVADVTGAGDTVIGALALSLAAGATLVEAAEIANHAAGVAVGHFGPAAVSRLELDEAIGSRREPTASS